MGFWGDGNLQNNTAGDWVGSLIYSRNRIQFIEKSINRTFLVKNIRGNYSATLNRYSEFDRFGDNLLAIALKFSE